jgi:hypothetical protein
MEAREWAKANGIEVGKRGRLPGRIVEAFEASKKSVQWSPDAAPVEEA